MLKKGRNNKKIEIFVFFKILVRKFKYEKNQRKFDSTVGSVELFQYHPEYPGSTPGQYIHFLTFS
jgi:hypothetical protein